MYLVKTMYCCEFSMIIGMACCRVRKRDRKRKEKKKRKTREDEQETESQTVYMREIGSAQRIKILY